MSVVHTIYPTLNPDSVHHVELQNIVCDSSHFHKTWTTEELEQVDLNDCPTKLILESLSNGAYRLLFGIKYFLAANLSGLNSLPALVLQKQQTGASIPKLAVDMFPWNYLDEIECAQAYLWLKEYYQYTTQELATLCSVSRPVISNQLRLLNLPLPIQGWLRNNTLSKSHCLLLLQLPTGAEQITMAEKIITEQPSVREVKSLIQAHMPTPVKKQDSGISIDESSQTITISYSSEAQKEVLLALLQTKLCNL